ncbi:hypothetical protein [Microbacterium deminutum]|uniref:DUF5709 domain-containing protein n=1 Tax=Microbacterium deminutum TaxID=344164 RepID=A0ABN2R004_9MICO
MSDDRERPQGEVNANPIGGWEDGRTADSTTEESGAAAAGYGVPGPIEVPPVEGSMTDADPDLVADADLEQGRAPDPAVDAAEHVRQVGGV